MELGIVMIIENREIMLKSSVGSVNYNLVTADSDKDYKFFVMPTFDDVYIAEHSTHALACGQKKQYKHKNKYNVE